MRDEAAAAERAYVFAYPLVVSGRALREANRLFILPGPGGTLRIRGWLDLGREPVALSLDDSFGRFYVVWLRDAWNSVFASLGARSTGTGAAAFAILGPDRQGDRLRPGLSPVRAPTRIVRVSGCIEAAGAEAAELAARIRVCGLSRWTGLASGVPLRPAERREHDLAARVAEVERLDAAGYFAEALRLSAGNPPEREDRQALDELRAVAARAGAGALAAGARRGRDAIRRAAAQGAERVGAWRVDFDLGRYGRDYLRRAAIARAGLAVEPAPDELAAAADADAEGRPLTGRARYVLRFPPDAAPPANAFWTLTTGAGSTGDLRGLALDADGALTIHIGHGAPAGGCRANWLPAPAGAFSVVLRLYWPAEQALDRAWSPPAPVRVPA